MQGCKHYRPLRQVETRAHQLEAHDDTEAHKCLAAAAGVLVLSEFAGAAQSLGAGAILVNPWNVTDMANAIEHALTMSNEERRERHRQNYHHVTHHTVQTWADVFITELNDTHVEAELRTKHIPPPVRTTTSWLCLLDQILLTIHNQLCQPVSL